MHKQALVAVWPDWATFWVPTVWSHCSQIKIVSLRMEAEKIEIWKMPNDAMLENSQPWSYKEFFILSVVFVFGSIVIGSGIEIKVNLTVHLERASHPNTLYPLWSCSSCCRCCCSGWGCSGKGPPTVRDLLCAIFYLVNMALSLSRASERH